MGTSQLVRQLVINDARLVLRDRMLATLLVLVPIIGLAARFALPAIDASLAEQGVLPSESTSLRFSDTFEMFVAFIALWQAALLPGTLFGFLLLDEKEDDTLTAMRVTPVPMQRYLAYRVAQPAVLAFGFSLLLVPVMGQAHAPWSAHLALAACAALTAPITALLLASFADNKVQGLAYTKFGGVAGLVILFGWFVPEPWQWMLSAFPPFLTSKAFWLLLEGRAAAWPVLAVATAVQLAILRLLVNRFRASR